MFKRGEAKIEMVSSSFYSYRFLNVSFRWIEIRRRETNKFTNIRNIFLFETNLLIWKECAIKVCQNYRSIVRGKTFEWNCQRVRYRNFFVSLFENFRVTTYIEDKTSEKHGTRRLSSETVSRSFLLRSLDKVYQEGYYPTEFYRRACNKTRP